MTRLIVLNGAPGIGKSTLGRRWAADRPPTLCCDIDTLRTMVGGWRGDFAGAGALIRPAALALITAYLEGGHDVVLPQLLTRGSEVDRFHRAATIAGADLVHVLLTDEPGAAVERFRARGATDVIPDPWHAEVRDLVREQGGDELVRTCCASLERLAHERDDIVVMPTRAGAEDDAFRALIDCLES